MKHELYLRDNPAGGTQAGECKPSFWCRQATCPTCAKPVGAFRDALSRKENAISGMCQECQDATFVNCDSVDVGVGVIVHHDRNCDGRCGM
jgi:hypothetical protein